MDKKRTNASVLKDLGENQIFSPLRIKGKTIENNIPLGLKILSTPQLTMRIN